MEIKERIRDCFEENGITITEDGVIGELSSVMFVTLILSLEDEFNIEFSDDYLNYDSVMTLERTCEIVQLLVEESEADA